MGAFRRRGISSITRPGRCPQPACIAGQQDRDHQAEGKHQQAQEPQAATEPVGDALKRREAAQYGAVFMLKAGPGESAPVKIVGNSCRSLLYRRTVFAEVETIDCSFISKPP